MHYCLWWVEGKCSVRLGRVAGVIALVAVIAGSCGSQRTVGEEPIEGGTAVDVVPTPPEAAVAQVADARAIITPAVAKQLVSLFEVSYKIGIEGAIVVVGDADAVDLLLDDAPREFVKGPLAVVAVFGDEMTNWTFKGPVGSKPPTGHTAYFVVSATGILGGGLLIANLSDEFASFGTPTPLTDLLA